ncbi:unnamed protein product [Mesocestoides corti]|uniref:Ig-like domain-containing protein n=3 Tax=Mesocestoides corti TaxID=53468 RepID=A0A0R3U4J8_MESCO|nr:unnamed protein product [Mesocestoides corti]
MIAVLALFCILPYIRAADPPPCNEKVNVKPSMMSKGGVPFQKLIVDSSTPIEIRFPVDHQVEIDEVKWTLNSNPIDVDQDETKSAVYWKHDASDIVLVIGHPKQIYIGNWQMELTTKSDQKTTSACQLQSPPMVQRFIESFRTTEGYEMVVVCKSGSLPYPSRVQWYRAEGTGDSVNLVPIPSSNQTHIPGDTLVFKEAKMSDSGVYVCNTTVGVNGLFDSSAVEVKIKSKLLRLSRIAVCVCVSGVYVVGACATRQRCVCV